MAAVSVVESPGNLRRFCRTQQRRFEYQSTKSQTLITRENPNLNHQKDCTRLAGWWSELPSSLVFGFWVLPNLGIRQSIGSSFSLAPAFRPVLVERVRHQPFQRLTMTTMSVHSYSRYLAKPIWSMLNRERMLTKTARPQISAYLTEYRASKTLAGEWQTPA